MEGGRSCYPMEREILTKMKPSGIVVMFWSTGSLLHNHFFSPFLFVFLGQVLIVYFYVQVNPHTHQLKLCDFGSAKVLVSIYTICHFLFEYIYNMPLAF